MDKYTGKALYNGIAIGKILFYKKDNGNIKKSAVDDINGELERFEKAKAEAIRQLKELHKKAVAEAGETSAAIFEVHAMMLQDEDYNDSIRNIIIGQCVNAEFAVAVTGNNFAKMFAGMEDSYFKARAVDMEDISDRVISNLKGKSFDITLENEPVIIVASEITPSETVRMDKNKVAAFVTHHGSSNSHTAVFARTLGIPALMGVNVKEEWDGKNAVVDGYTGTLFINPDEDLIKHMSLKQNRDVCDRNTFNEYIGQETVTKRGKKVRLYNNIGRVFDIDSVIANDAEGIGLFRSELIYLESNRFPNEDEQFLIYKKLCEKMNGRETIIRTLDIGADKKVGYFNLKDEENPAMGYRAIRICLKEPEIFKVQLRALLKAACYGNLSVMYPMITSISEILQIRKLIDEVKAELKREGISYRIPKQGIMVETPAAALISDELAEYVDFFNIGTNDLTQYTLAASYQNEKIDDFYNPHHKAVFRMIQMVINNAHKRGKWVGICGELASDASVTRRLVRMGIDELSVAPMMTLQIRKIIRDME